MFNINDELTVKVEKMVYEGAGLAKVDNFPIFIDNACVGDEVKIKITNAKQNFANAQIVEVIQESPFRVKPVCALHNVCGGCQWQFINYNEQLNQKQNIVKETIKKITGEDINILPVIASPKQTAYRHKVQYPISQTKVSKRLLAGYYKKNSHELINIKYCPIQHKVINELIDAIKEKAQELKIDAYNEKKRTGLLRHVIFKYSSTTRQNLIIFVTNSNEVYTSIKKLANYIYENFKNISGVCVNLNTKNTNAIMSKETQCLVGNNFYTEKVGDITYKISANSFFQVNPYSAEKMFDTVKKMVKENTTNPTILDAYSGVASFALQLKDIASKITCVEEVKSAHQDALENIKVNNAKNIEAINGDAALIFEDLIKKNEKFDVVLLDPPRKGCDKKALDYAIKLAKSYIIYVSCNPATLARDLKYLHENGFKTKYIQPVDMFPHTYHIESISLIKRD